MIGIPPRVAQEELYSKKAQIETRVKLNEAVMEWDPNFTNLIEDSMYGNTPVHYISMVS